MRKHIQETSVTHLRNALAASIEFRKISAMGMFRVAHVPLLDRNGLPVCSNSGAQETRPVLVEKDPSEAFKKTSFMGRPVPGEPFVRIQLIKPLFENALARSHVEGNVKITDAHLETKGDAREFMNKLCDFWDGILPAGLSQERREYIISFFRYEGNRIYLAEPGKG